MLGAGVGNELLINPGGFHFLEKGLYLGRGDELVIFAVAVVVVLSLPGELAFTVWLLWKGVNVERWKKRTLESA